MIDLPHMAARVFGTPLMIARAKLEVILGVLAPRFSGQALSPIDSEPTATPPINVTDDGIAVVPILGTLVARSGYLDAASGLQSYAEIGAAIAMAMDDASVRGVILDVDSPGGEVGGLFDIVDSTRAIKAASSKPLWAVANESALSAAYAIASAADRLYVTRTAEVGSIGVVAVHVDESAADTKAGLAWSFVFAGERKVDGNPHAPLSEQARATIQADVDRLYGEFCTLVAANRRMSVEAVRTTEAAIFRGELAIRAGLADRIGTLEAAVVDLAAALETSPPIPRSTINPTPRRSSSMTSNSTETAQAESAQDQQLPATADPKPSPLSVQEPAEPATPNPPGPQVTETLRAEYAEIADVAAQAARLGVTIDAADAMRKGVKPEALRRSVLDALSQRAEATNIIAAAPSTPTAGDSPIVRRAKERAASSRT